MIKLCRVCQTDKEFGSRHKALTCTDCVGAGVKFCTVCETTQPLTNYSRSGMSYQGYCKACAKDKCKNDDYRKRHALRQKERYAKDESFRIKHRAKVKELRYLRRGASGTHTVTEWNELLAKYDNKCAYCSTTGALTKDHVIAITKGGTNDIENIAPACTRCNSSKGNKDLNEWLGELQWT